MAAAKTYAVYFINLHDGEQKGGDDKKGGGIKFAWRAPADTYPDEIAKELGVSKAQDKETGLIFGMNSPRPIKIRVNVSAKQGSSKSVLLFCDPGKLSHLMIGNPLKGKAFRKGTITTVSTPGSSTNPHRKKAGSTNKATTKKPTTKKPTTKKPTTKKATK